MIWTFAGGIMAGAGIGFLLGEYYRRIIDGIRREQIADLRSERPERVAWDEVERPRRRKQEDLISEERFDELKATGRTAGRRIGGVNA